MGDVEEEIDEIDDEYEDDFDVDDEDGAATAHDAPHAARKTEPAAGSVSLASCTTGVFPGSDAQNTTAAAGVQREDETLEERIKRKQEEVPVLSVRVSVCLGAWHACMRGDTNARAVSGDDRCRWLGCISARRDRHLIRAEALCLHVVTRTQTRRPLQQDEKQMWRPGMLL